MVFFTVLYYFFRNWKLAKKEIIIIVNKRIASKIYEQVMKFEPNLFWKNLNLKRIHSFYLDITTLKNLKKVLPPILTHPLECCFEGDSLSMSELSNCYISDSIKMMVGKGQNLNTGEILDNPLMFSSMVGRKISRKKKNCSIF